MPNDQLLPFVFARRNTKNATPHISLMRFVFSVFVVATYDH